MAQTWIQGICPFCQTPIRENEESLVCPGCKVPHHADCWQQNGACTTFACRGEAATYDESLGQDYSFDDLAAEYAPGKLVIELEDLPPDYTGAPAPAYPGLPDHQESGPAGDRGFRASKVPVQLALGGAFAGALVWLIALNIFNFTYYATTALHNLEPMETAFFAAIMGGVIGATLGSVEGITGKVFQKMVSGFMTGLLIGSLGGFIGAGVGYLLYGYLFMSIDDPVLSSNLYRGLFWGFTGAFIGLGQGIGSGGRARVVNGLLGGLVGGFAAGLIFDSIFANFDSADTGAFMAIAFFGAVTGITIGGVYDIRKEAWLMVTRGETAGKEYLVNSSGFTTIGSSPQCDIVLIRDAAVADHHADIEQERIGFTITACRNARELNVGGRQLNQALLKDGDLIRIGSYELRFHEKKIRAG